MTVGTFRYGVPDLDILPEQRALYLFPANKEVKDERQLLHDVRSSPSVVNGPDALDVQGFAYVNHVSSLKGDEWFKDDVDDIYIKEVVALVCKVTGANRAIVDGMSFRRRLASQQTDPYHYEKKGSEIDVAISKLPRDKLRVVGKTIESSAEPARLCHIDYTVQGLKDTIQFCREDLCEAGRHITEAESQSRKGEEVRVPRFAAYSVWRPLETVQRDPLAVLDWRTTNLDELVHVKSRALSSVTENCEFLRESSYALPPKSPQAHRWCWMSEQTPDEVLIVKFADSAGGDGVAAGCVHCSPSIEGTENLPTRKSVECRVIAFWD